MRYFCFLVLIAAPNLFAAELPDAAERALSRFETDVAEAQQERQRTIEQAEVEHREALAAARKAALRALKRSIGRSMPAPEQAVVYRTILRLDSDDADAVAFFTALGSLEQVLADIEPLVEEDFLGQPLAAEGLGADHFVANGRVILLETARQWAGAVSDLNAEQWARLPGHELVVPANQATNTGIRLEPGQAVLVMPHPDDRWEGGVGQGLTGWAGPNGMMILTATINGTVTVLTNSLIVSTGIPGELVLGPQDIGYFDNTGQIRVKLIPIRQ